MKRLILLMFVLLMVGLPSLYAQCSVIKDLTTATIYDFIEPDGRDASCQVQLLQDGYLFETQDMSQNDLYYNATFSDLNYGRTYRAFIECNRTTVYYYSECYFSLKSQIGSEVGTEQVIVLSLSYPYYLDVNTTERITLFVSNFSGRVGTILFNGTVYPMDNDTRSWYVDVTSSVEEDVNFTVFVNESATGQPIYNRTGVMRWRRPFYVDIWFYKTGAGTNASLAERYDNDFQYVFLLPKNNTIGSTWLDLDGSTDWFSWLDPIYYWMLGVEYTPEGIDGQLAFWGNYKEGGGQVKLYEGGNYSINLESTKAKKSTGWKYEFVYPQVTNADYFHEILVLNIDEEVDQSFEIYIDRWEISWFKVMMNWVWIVAWISIYLIIVIGVACVSKDAKVTSIVASVLLGVLITLLALT